MSITLKIGLRIDVDTLRGTRIGVPALEKLLFRYGILASFFFSVGPDNMGRNLWRLLKPAFLKKMLRSKATSLYGWDILLMGTFFPGPLIGKSCHDIIRKVADQGHEIGLHAWDHYTWQSRMLSMDEKAVHASIKKGYDELIRITDKAPTCSAAPGWIANNTVLLAKDRFPFTYNSDCRGNQVFIPDVGGKHLRTPQIPVTLPTYDEIIGRDGITKENYNTHLLAMIKPDDLNVLTIHAEVEGIVCLDLFEDFIKQAHRRNMSFVPLSGCLSDQQDIQHSQIALETIAGREGQLAVQAAHLLS
ncbi:MAG: 4-deoxy-4-formamido-L-arabinose-phosphoundecaprenol deformylase [Desulfobacteraceae bacterium]|jgi:undecaprenyl phosphate-alpha-L-ara4FN deformylase